jgi:serine/threonine-protein kinase
MSSEPVARFATHASTVVGAESAPAPAEPPAAAGSGPLFRPAEAIHGPSSMDLRMRRDLWWLSLVTPVLCVAVVTSSFLLGGASPARRLLVAGMITNAACGSWVAWMARRARLTARTTAAAWLLLAAGGCTAILYYGVMSPVGLMLAVLVVFFVGVRGKRPVAVMVYLVFAVFHAALVGLLAAGAAPALGVLPVAAGEPGTLVVTELLIQLVLLATMVAAAAVRHSTATALRELEQQAREVGRHELLLDDAKRAFEATLRAAGGGRFTHQVVGSYRLGRLLGEGSMGEVYDATDTRTGIPAAVKLLRRNVMTDQRMVQRFLTEARIVRSLDTEHIARVLDTADPASGLPYIAMERLHGRDLRKHLAAHRDCRLLIAEAEDLLRQVARGIDAAHQAGVVHRDLKPSNLFRTAAGVWKILDFGVSKVIGEHTVENAFIGTPNFMSPEQANRGDVDGRTDIFALGAIVYYAITGTLAFAGDTLAAIALQVTHHTPPPASQRVPGIPAGVDTAVMTALAKDPQQRFATAGAFADAFSAALAAARRDGGRASEPAALAGQRRHDRPASAPVT